MSELISIHIPELMADKLRQYALRKQCSVNEVFAVVVEEWTRQNEFAYIEFRDVPNGRMAYMKGSRLPVWWVVNLAQLYGMDVEKTAAYWDKHHSKEWVQAALNYYQAFPAEIDRLIAAQVTVT